MVRLGSRLAGVALVLFAVAGFVAADEEKVPLDKVPKAVLEAVKVRFPQAKVNSAEKETEDGKTVYEIAITEKEQNIEVTVTTDAKIVEIEKQIVAKDLPAGVARALEGKYPKATFKMIEEVWKVTDGKENLEYYEVLLVTQDKKKFEVSVTAEGKITKQEDKSNEKD